MLPSPTSTPSLPAIQKASPFQRNPRLVTQPPSASPSAPNLQIKSKTPSTGSQKMLTPSGSSSSCTPSSIQLEQTTPSEFSQHIWAKTQKSKSSSTHTESFWGTPDTASLPSHEPSDAPHYATRPTSILVPRPLLKTRISPH